MQDEPLGRENDDIPAGESSRSETPTSILLVEDEGIVAQDLQETLIQLGYQVVGIQAKVCRPFAWRRNCNPT